MNKFQLTFRSWILIVFVCAWANGQNECPVNEIPTECEDPCNRCENYQQQMCTMECSPGCNCIPGYVRETYSGNCIPRQFCPGTNKPRYPAPQSDAIKKILDWEDNKKGCPDEIQCRMNCKQGGLNFRDGLCTGPNRKHCACYSCRSTSPGEPVPEAGLCPNLVQCISSCVGQGYADGGQCTGPRRDKCECFGDISRGDDSLLSPNTVRGGCPFISRCINFCNVRGFRSGICLGPKKEYCNCYSKLPDTRTGILQPITGVLDPNIGQTKPGPGRAGSGRPPSNPSNPQTGDMGCPDLAKCISGCLKSGKDSGFCSGVGRRSCTCE